MATVHMSEAELALDLHGVLARVRQGVEVVIEQDNRAVAVIKSSEPRARERKLSEYAKEYEEKLGTGYALDSGTPYRLWSGHSAEV